MNSLRFHAMLRLLAASVTILLVAAAPDFRVRAAIIFSLAFSHYLLGLWYARRKTQLLLAHVATAAGLIALALLAFGLFVLGVSVLAFFAIHHAANEVYLADRAAGDGPAALGGWFRGAGVVFNAALYLMLIRADPWLPPIDVRLLLAVTVASGILFAILLLRRTESLRAAVELASLEIVILALVIAGVEVRGVDVVFYHVFFWSLYPIAGMLRESRSAGWGFIAANAACTGLFLAISPLTAIGRPFEPQWYSMFILTSFVHITLAFGLSAAHPAWMRRQFELRTSPEKHLLPSRT